MEKLIRDLDWSRTPLGPMERWSPALRMMVTFLLANRFPLLLWWGPQFVSIYNDAYRPVLGAKHPWALGQPVSVCWQEIWHILQPLIETPYRGGPATWMEDLELEIRRHGYPEETHFTIAYSPVPDENVAGGIGGVLATVHEITEKVIGERRVAMLRDLGTRGMEAKTAEEACAIAAAALGPYAKDVPFALFYLLDASRSRARLAGAAGVEPGASVCPLVIDLDEPEAAWPLAEVIRLEQTRLVERLDEKFPELPAGPWSDPPKRAAITPIKSNLAHQLAGFLVVGVSARLRFDEQYRSFVELTASQVAAAIATARAYEEERRRADALAEIDHAKTTFFSNVSHEFRTPLTLMLGPLEDVLRKPKDAPLGEVYEQLRVTHRNSLRLLKIVNTLLDFSRIEAGRLTAHYEPVDLAAFTAELCGLFRSAIEKAGLRFRVECAPLAEPAFVDRDMWEKIVFNLLSNALKFTFTGEIVVQVCQRDNWFELAVSDTGVGIPEREMPNLFKRFHRIENVRSRTHEGTGIGLAFVQELAKQHGGNVTATSRLGEGSVFTVTIPTGREHLPAENIEPTSTLSDRERPVSTSRRMNGERFQEEALRWVPSEQGAALPLTRSVPEQPIERRSSPVLPSPARIVLADDNADMRDYVRRLLGVSYRVDVFADGESALAAIRERRPDLVLTDVMMPRLDGFGLLRAIREDAALSDVPVIMLSARADDEASTEGFDAGANDYLIKPFTARELLARVGSHLKMARLRKQAEESSRRLAAIVESSDDAIIAKNLDGTIMSWNEGARHLFGYTADEIIGKSILTLIPPERHAEEPIIIERLRRGERIEQFETVRLRKDGTFVEVSLTVSPVRNERGQVIGASKIARDITARLRAERQQRALSEMIARVNRAAALSEIYDAALSAMEQCLHADRGSILLYDSAQVMRFVAWRGLSDAYRSAVEGHSPWQPDERNAQPVTIDDLAQAALAPSLRTVIDSEGIRALAFVPLKYEGRLRGKFMLYYNRPHRFEPAELEMAMAIASQIAFAVERQKGAEALEALVAERTQSLRQAIGQMEEFSYSVSHDLRAPVRAMQGYAEALLEDYSDDLGGEGRELLQRIQRAGGRMDRLIQDLLTYTRISRREMKLEAISLARLIREVMQQYPELQPKRAQIEIAQGMPDVLAHEPSLTQVVSNLLSNAVKFVAANRHPCVRIGFERRGELVRVNFDDNGIGIPPEYHHRLFGMFERLHVDRSYEGTGIGLAIVRKAVERMNGKVGMESDGLNGSRFWIELATPKP